MRSQVPDDAILPDADDHVTIRSKMYFLAPPALVLISTDTETRECRQ